MSASDERPLRIGQVAELTGVTQRTIRYYEEIGLLDAGDAREQGKHRCYSQQDVERIQELVRLRDLLGLSLDELSQLLDAEQARAEIRREYRATDDPERQQALLEKSIELMGRQLELVRNRIDELSKLEAHLLERREYAAGKLGELV